MTLILSDHSTRHFIKNNAYRFFALKAHNPLTIKADIAIRERLTVEVSLQFYHMLADGRCGVKIMYLLGRR